jgi:hypothetical protein
MFIGSFGFCAGMKHRSSLPAYLFSKEGEDVGKEEIELNVSGRYSSIEKNSPPFAMSDTTTS